MTDLFESILVAVDTTDSSLDAARAASELAQAHGSSLAFVHVVNEDLARELAHAMGRPETAVLADLEANGRHYLAEARRLAAALGVSASEVLRPGRPSVEVLAEAHARHATLLVLGKASIPPLHPHAGGRVLERILDAAELPVLVVPREGRPALP
jgi:nucleotide-binding universal stress UspA family protein